MLSDGNSSRIYRSLVYEKRLALAAFGGGNIVEDPNLFFATAVVQPGQSTEAAIKALTAELDRLREEPISERELERTKNQWARDYLLSRLTIQDKASMLAHAAVIHNDLKTADGEFDIFQRTTAADVQRVARTYFTPATRTIHHHDPAAGRRADRGGEPVMARLLRRLREHAFLIVLIAAAPAVVCAQSAGWPSERPPRPLDPHPVTFPLYELRTLPNGLQVVVVRQNEQPVVSVRMLVRAGSAQDPPDKPGVAEMVATLLDQGTATRSAAEIADIIDFMGGGLGTGAGTDLSFANTILLQSNSTRGHGCSTSSAGRRSRPRSWNGSANSCSRR